MSTQELRLVLDVPFSDTLGLDVYVPDATAHRGLRPLIMWVHGGGFRPGNDKSQSYIVALATEFAKRGYVCVAPDYRLRDAPMDDLAGTIRDAVDDVALALQWVRDRADRYGADPSNVFLAGGSAGGMTVVTLCYTRETGLRGLINLWGSPAPEYTAGYSFPQKTPYFSVHGTADQLVPYRYGTALLERLRERGVEADLLEIRDGRHTPMDHQDQIVQAVQEFLDRWTGPQP